LRDAIHESPVSRVLKLATPSVAPSLEKTLMHDPARDAVEKSEGVGGVTDGEGQSGGGEAGGVTEVVEDIADEEAGEERQ